MRNKHSNNRSNDVVIEFNQQISVGDEHKLDEPCHKFTLLPIINTPGDTISATNIKCLLKLTYYYETIIQD